MKKTATLQDILENFCGSVHGKSEFNSDFEFAHSGTRVAKSP